MTLPLPGALPVHHRRRVLVVDDHPLMRESIAKIVNRAPDLEVCGEADSVDTALARLAEARPDVIVSDLALFGENGFLLLDRLCAERSNVPVLIVSMHSDSLHGERAIQAGAAGYVMKGEGGDAIVAAVQAVLAGKVVVSPRVRTHLLQRLTGQPTTGTGPPFQPLSAEERLVFAEINRPEPEAVVALSLGLSAGQYRARRASIRAKLHLANDVALRHYAWLWADAGRPAA